MSAARRKLNSILRRTARATAVGFFCWLSASSNSLVAQPPKGPAALKLPDGTIVLYTKAPDDPNPPIDAVVLTPQEYRALQDQADQLKKLKESPKPQPPSGCAIAVKVVSRGERAVAVVSIAYQVRTDTARTPVPLGTPKAFPNSAKFADGRLPILLAGEDGFTAFPDAAGDHILALELEAPIASRGPKGELGFEIGLPRAAITTLTFEPPSGIKKVALSVRTLADKPGEVKTTIEDAAKLTRYPLGPVDLLQLSWEPPASPNAAAEVLASADAEIAVRIDDLQVETTAVLQLRGTAKEWSIIAPANSDLTVDTAVGLKGPFAVPSAALVRPSDPNKTVWTFRPPEGAGTAWVVTAIHRTTRPKPAEPKFKGPYPVGPFAVPTAGRLTGTVKVFAPPTTRVTFPSPNPEVRRQDAVGSEEDLIGLFRIAAGPAAGKSAPPPLLQLETRAAPGFVRVSPTYVLRRTEIGWRLDLEARITPVRTDVERLLVDIPAGWQAVEASPADLVEVQVPDAADPMAARTLALRLTAAQKAPFDLVLTSIYPVATSAREASILLPRFAGGAQEQLARIAAIVPEGLEVHGTAHGADTGQPASVQELKAPASIKPTGATTAAAARFEKSAARVDLNWHVYRPELTAEVRAELSVQERQIAVLQTIRFRAGEGELRPMKFAGPVGLTGLRGPLEPSRPGEWLFRPPADGSKEFVATLTYALPFPVRKADAVGPIRFPIALLWPEAATKTEVTVRIWNGGTSRSVSRFDGPWRELPPEPSPDRDSLPWLTLAGSGSSLPLALELADDIDGGAPAATVDRVLVQAWVGDDGAIAVRTRFLLRRWSPAGIDVELPAGVVAEFKLDDRRADAIPGSAGESRTVRIPVPERAGRASLLLDVRYVIPPSQQGELGLHPPRVANATYRQPARWQVIVPHDSIPLCVGRDLQPEIRWDWRSGLFAPSAGSTTRELEQWLAGASETPSEGEEPPASDVLTARQPILGPVPIVSVRRGWWIGACSLVALVLGYGLSRLRPALLGPALAVLGLGVAVPAAGWPQLAAHAAAASVPGLLASAILLAALATLRWSHRRRAARLPGFTRVRPEAGLSRTANLGSRAAPPMPATSGSAIVLEGSDSQPTLTTPSGS